MKHTSWLHSPVIKTNDWSDTASELRCPRCDSAYLHHEGVTVYDRKEDARSVIETTVRGGKVSVVPSAPGVDNPSSRRDGIAVLFSCEGCGDDPIEMTIAQHKGTTEIGWRYVEVE